MLAPAPYQKLYIESLHTKNPLTKIAVESKIPEKSTPGIALVEVLQLGVASLAGLQPNVRRYLEKVANYSLDPSKQILFG